MPQWRQCTPRLLRGWSISWLTTTADGASICAVVDSIVGVWFCSAVRSVELGIKQADVFFRKQKHARLILKNCSSFGRRGLEFEIDFEGVSSSVGSLVFCCGRKLRFSVQVLYQVPGVPPRVYNILGYTSI